MIDLFKETPITFVPLDERARYSWAVKRTVSTALAELITLSDEVERYIAEIEELLDPWTPVHPKEGKMSKRIPSVMFKKYGIDLSPDSISSLANYLGADIPANGVLFDIDRKFGWTDGEFGDKRSCFFTDGNNALRILRQGGCSALRFWSGSVDNPKGAARALVLPTEAGLPLICNAYGASLAQFKSRLDIISDYTAESKYVEAESDKPITVNLRTGVIVAEKGKAPERLALPVKLNIDMDEANKYECGHCGKRVKLQNIVRRGLVYYCRACMDELFFKCEYSNQYYPKEDMLELLVVDVPGYDEAPAPMKIARRYDHDFTPCDCCKQVIYPGNRWHYTRDDKTKGTFCTMCRAKQGYTHTCQRCGLAIKPGKRCVCRG